jgi:hypothetical protein
VPTEHNPETGSTKLKRMILDQALQHIGIPMVLFSSETLAATDGSANPQPLVVEDAAEQAGVELSTLELFSFDAYRLQTALGETLGPARA